MNRLIGLIKNNIGLIFLGFFIALAAILRFTNITKLEFFTYDQARDALFVKRMVVDHDWRLLGTQTSLPGMYLPPFYFYTIAPILWLFRLNPIGIDIYSAFIGVLTVPLVYFVANRTFGRPAGIFSAGLFAVSPLVVELTRRAWNPNTLPFFVLLSFYFAYIFLKENRLRDLLLAFVVYGYCLSLHFGAWLLAPLYLALLIYGYWQKKIKTFTVWWCIGILLIFVSPLILFDFTHQHILFTQANMFFFDGGHLGPGQNNVIEGLIASLVAVFTILISGKINVGYGAPLEFNGRISDLFRLSEPISVVAQKPFSISFQWWGIALFLGIIGYSLWVIINIKRQSFDFAQDRQAKNSSHYLGLILVWIWLIWGILASKLYSGKFFFFYYLYLFPAPILLFGWFMGKLSKNTVGKIVAVCTFTFIVIYHWHFSVATAFNWRDYNLLKLVGGTIANQVTMEPFNIATIQKEADRWDRNAVDYRYFTETYFNKRALDWYPQDYQNAKQLFVVDETNNTDVLISPIMEIQEFKPSTISGQWQVGEGEQKVTIYRLDKL